jgi:hypothetical protein
MKVRFASMLLMGIAPVSIAFAQQPTPALQALDDALPGTLINDPSKLDWPIFGPGVKSKAVKDKSIPGGGGALQITSPSVAPHIYDIGANAPIRTAIASGKKIVVAFYARTIKADTPDGRGKIGLRIQQNAAPYPGFGDTVLNIGPDWQLYEVKTTSNIKINEGLAVVGFQLSGAKQTIEIGQTIVVEGADSLKTVTKTATAGTAAAGGATTLAPNLTGKGTLLNTPENLQSWGLYGAALTHKAVPAKTMPGGTAMAINVSAAGPNIYDSGASISFDDAVSEGDVMTIAFVARTLSADTENGAGKIALRVQRNIAPYTGFGDNTLAIGPNWKLYQLRTQAKVDISKGQGAVSLQFGGAKQSLEIGPVYILNAGPPAPTAN